ncbi:MAG: hypothetical protein WDA09_09330 [Bacteriovoracaceae bacterium]
MSILNYLPEFKVVEINRSTGLVTGHILSQFPLDPASTLIKEVGGHDVVENGFIVGLGKDLQIDAYDPAKHAAPFLIFTEELNTFMGGLKYFATEEDGDGDIYPRAVGLFVGDVFTTNNYAVAGAVAPKYAKVVNGKLTLQDAADAATMFVVEGATTPNGEDAYKFIYFGLTAAVFAAAAAAATPEAIEEAVEDVLTAELADGGEIDLAIDAVVEAAITAHAALTTGVHGLEE